MNSFIVIYTTFKDRLEGDKIVDVLIEKKLIACANFLSLEARYFWEGELANVGEVGALLKTKKENWELVKAEIEKMHSYKIPCIIKFGVESNQSYSDWVKEETSFLQIERPAFADQSRIPNGKDNISITSSQNFSSPTASDKNFSDQHRSFKLSQQAVIVNEKNEVLILKSTEASKTDSWLLPGGRVDVGENNLEEALKRELKEEINLEKISIKQVIGTGVSTGFNTIAIAYLVEVEDIDNLRLSDEHEKFQWVNPVELEKHLYYKKIGREIYNHFKSINPGSGN